MSRGWTDREIARVLKMREGGMTYDEIAAALGKSKPSVKSAIARRFGRKGTRDELVYYHADAKRGSARLLAEIQRVFGSQMRRAA